MSLISFIRGVFSREDTEEFELPQFRYEGGDGSTLNDAIVVRGARSDLEGTAATFLWMHQHVGAKNDAWRLVTHSTGEEGVRKIDTFSVILRDGTHRSFYFDVTESFGKPPRGI